MNREEYGTEEHCPANPVTHRHEPDWSNIQSCFDGVGNFVGAVDEAPLDLSGSLRDIGYRCQLDAPGFAKPDRSGH